MTQRESFKLCQKLSYPTTGNDNDDNNNDDDNKQIV